jgi:WD40-like Beta Propeller Repeat
MTLSARLGVLMIAVALQACVSSSLVLHVNADGSGKATITSRVFVSNVQALDSLFGPADPAKPPKLEELLPPPLPGALDHMFGTSVRLASSSLEPAADGGVRTTVVQFSDIRGMRLMFPSPLMTAGDTFISTGGVAEAPIITFTIRPHENGDEMLVVKMPDPVVSTQPDEEITKFETNSPEELAFKRAIKGMAIRFSIETEQPILRSNAPKMMPLGATILDLDLDRMINAMDEPKVRRMMAAGSFQQMLWQLGDLPGAAIPVDHEVFLEYQPPVRAAAQTPAAQAPPDTEIYLAPVRSVGGTITIGAPENITNNPGYDNQPFFTPDGRSVLFTSVRGGGTQTDIYRYDLATKQTAQVTHTSESEYSPTVTPSGALSVVRVENDDQKTQRLWQFTMAGADPRVILADVKPVGYHAWADDGTLALFVLGANRAPATLQLADARTGTAVTLATDIGRSIQPIPGSGTPRHISFVQRERSGDTTRLVIKELDPATRAISVLTPAVEGSTEADVAWMPNGMLLMARGGILYLWRRGESAWTEVASLERLSLSGVTRLAVSPKGDYLALVAAAPPAR